MSQNETLISDREWRDIINFYFQAKALVALAEISDMEQQLCVSAITELRSALDHLMRVQHVSILEGRAESVLAAIDDDPRPKVPEGEAAQKNYRINNLLKIKGHLYRAAYDSLDVLVMSNLTDYEGLTKHFDFDDICEVIPSFPTCHAKIEEARRMVVQCKMFKDIETDDTVESMEGKLLVNGQVIENYLSAHKMVKDVCKLIRENALEIRAAVRRRKKALFMPILIGVCTSLFAAIIIAVAVWIVQFLPVPKSGRNGAQPVPSAQHESATQQPPGDFLEFLDREEAGKKNIPRTQ